MVDDCIGRVVAALKAKGIWDDTLVVFCTDHGEMLGSHWLMGKMCAYEASSRLVWCIKPPGGGTTGRRSHLVSAIDFAATVCDYAGAAPPKGNQGISLRRLIESPDLPSRDAVFMEWHGNQGLDPHYRMKAMVSRNGHGLWKWILHATGESELYHLDTDRLETRNLADDPPADAPAAEPLHTWGLPMTKSGGCETTGRGL
jgi:arylsulfatase A-like enzyme